MLNYFAHLHIAEQANSSLTGNLLGDFVKGSNLSHLPVELENGIRLHRKVDSFTDSHPLCIEFKSQNQTIRRYAGIGLDILFDHLLIKQLGKNFLETKARYYTSLRQESERYQAHLPINYLSKLEAIVKQDWFETYCHFDGICIALHNTAKRFKQPVDFNMLINWYQNNAHEVDEQFETLYQDTLTFAKSYVN